MGDASWRFGGRCLCVWVTGLVVMGVQDGVGHDGVDRQRAVKMSISVARPHLGDDVSSSPGGPPWLSRLVRFVHVGIRGRPTSMELEPPTSRIVVVVLLVAGLTAWLPGNVPGRWPTANGSRTRLPFQCTSMCSACAPPGWG